MNAYRVALILCRAVVVALWWSVGLQLLSLAVTAIVAQLNFVGLAGVAFVAWSVQPMTNIVSLAVVAGFLQIFAASLATSMTGGAAFEGDSIASNRSLDATERALGNAGGGLFLLFFGAVSAIPIVISGVYALFSGGFGSGSTVPLIVLSLLRDLVLALLKCVVGFVLAFSLSLRRLVKAR